MSMTANKPHDLELFATIGGQEYSVTVDKSEPSALPGRELPHYYVTVAVYQEDLKWWKCVFSESAEDVREGDLLDAVRWAFKRIRSRQNGWVRLWVENRHYASLEQGGKRSYYTKHANKARKIALEYAPKWRLCKQIWKEITKL
jgi:hypothetical protein